MTHANDFQVRCATPADACTIIGFQLQMALESEGLTLDRDTLEKGVTAALSDPAKGRYLIVCKGNQAIGSLMLTFEWSDWNNSRYMWIQSVYIRPEFRRRGAYRALYSTAREMARREGIGQIRLYVDKSNTAGIKTYQALGMRESHYLMFEAEADSDEMTENLEC